MMKETSKREQGYMLTLPVYPIEINTMDAMNGGTVQCAWVMQRTIAPDTMRTAMQGSTSLPAKNWNRVSIERKGVIQPAKRK